MVVSAAEVPAGEMGVSSAPAAAASAMAAGKAMAAAMSTSVAPAMPAAVASATSAGGRKGWGKGYRSADGCIGLSPGIVQDINPPGCDVRSAV